MKAIDCEYAPDIHYWNYWAKEFDYEKRSWEELKNKRQGNYYVSCASDGSAHMINAYVFKDYKLLFSQEDIYRGRFFSDNDNNFYIVEGILNPRSNADPLGFVLTKYYFNQAENIIVKVDSREYMSRQEIESLYNFEKENNIYFDNADYYNKFIKRGN